MADLEGDVIFVSHHFGSVLKDIFLIWCNTEETLAEFFQFFNLIDTDIKFSMTWSRENIKFLDTVVYIDGNRLKTDLFVKPTDKNNLLQFKSQHPKGMMESLPYSQLLRVKRIVDDPNYYERRKSEMCKFKDRGYPKALIQRHIKRVDDIERVERLSEKPRLKEKRIEFR